MVFAYDNFDFTAGADLDGRVAPIGGTWTNISTVIAQAINYLGNRLGERNSLPNSSAIYYNTVATPSADYGVRVNFIAGNSVFGQNSLGIILRQQQTVPSVTLDFYSLYFAYQQNWVLFKRSDTGGGNFTLFSAQTLTPGQTYLVDFSITGNTLTVAVDGVTIITHTDTTSPITPKGSIAILVNNCVTAFNNTDGWWFGDYTAYDSTPGDANFGLYFAGSGSAGGEDFAPVQYSTPTPVIIGNPVAGTEYAISVKPTDLAGFVNSRMGNVKLRRNGADTQGTTPAVLRGISVLYRKQQS